MGQHLEQTSRPEDTHPGFGKGCVEVRRYTDEENIGKKYGYCWRNVVPKPWSRKSKEQSSRDDSKECSKDIKWPLPSIDKSAVQKEDSIAVEVLVISSSTGLMIRDNRCSRVDCRRRGYRG